MQSTLLLRVKSKRDTRKRMIKSGIYVTVILIAFLLLLSAGNASAISTDSITSSESTILSTDTDKDGLTDAQEDMLGTNKTDYFGDWDGDGLYDFEERLDIYGDGILANGRKYAYNNATSVSNVLGCL